MEKLGLMNLMFSPRNGGAGYAEWKDEHLTPLLNRHPGVTNITAGHVAYCAAKLNAYKTKHPTHRAEYPPPKPGAEPIMGNFYREADLVQDPEFDGYLCRGEWLLYWLRWAVENCECPVFVNS